MSSVLVPVGGGAVSLATQCSRVGSLEEGPVEGGGAHGQRQAEAEPRSSEREPAAGSAPIWSSGAKPTPGDVHVHGIAPHSRHV